MRLLFTFIYLLTLSTQAHAELKNNEISKLDAMTGSNIKKSNFWNGLPLNKKFDELNAQEKSILNLSYPNLKYGDEPPYPQEGLRPLITLADKIQQKIVTKGDLQLLIEVDENGNGDNVQILQTPNSKLAEIMASALLLSKFKPAICNGTPCKMHFPLSLTFGKSYQ